MPRRCVCGRSKTFPVCDGSHGTSWSCEIEVRPMGHCILAGPALVSLGERLAHHLQAALLTQIDGPIRAESLLILTDGTDLDTVRALSERVAAGSVEVLVVDGPAEAGLAFEGARVRTAEATDPLHLWRAVLTALDRPPEALPDPPRVFLSHAVADEAVLQPAIDYLRRTLGLEIFLCADSIGSGTEWRARIDAALREADCFVLAGSSASFSSTYCAYEAGYASALGVRCRIVSLDGSPPPAFLSHLQMSDCRRHQARRPWLSMADALLECLLDALAGDP